VGKNVLFCLKKWQSNKFANPEYKYKSRIKYHLKPITFWNLTLFHIIPTFLTSSKSTNQKPNSFHLVVTLSLPFLTFSDFNQSQHSIFLPRVVFVLSIGFPVVNTWLTWWSILCFQCQCQTVPRSVVLSVNIEPHC